MMYKRIIFFDSDCLLCDRVVYFLIKRDKKHLFYYAPLNGKIYLSHFEKEQWNSVIYYKEGRIYNKSSAVILIIADLGSYYRLIFILFLIPKFIRDWFYSTIANNRHRFFKGDKFCYFLSDEEKGFILSDE